MRSSEHKEEVKDYFDNKIEIKRSVEQNQKNIDTLIKRQQQSEKKQKDLRTIDLNKIGNNLIIASSARMPQTAKGKKLACLPKKNFILNNIKNTVLP